MDKVIEIIEENDLFLAVYKPEGIEFHGEEGVVSLLRQQTDYPVFGVHRLDKETSGTMIFAKNKEIQGELSKLFAQKKVKKTYLAISKSKPQKKQGWVKGDLLKGRNGNYRLMRTMDNPSMTQFKSFYIEDQSLRGFLLYPHTGKTHQLRVVLKSLGSPILGDNRYGNDEAFRMYLHCYEMKFKLYSKSYSLSSWPKNFLSLHAFKLNLETCKN